MERYKFDKSIALVTIASPINQNLALLDVDEHLTADSFAVIHDGYINVIPILNSTRRSKYVALNSGNKRGIGLVKHLQMKWLRLKGETLFIILSSIGVQIYDAEVTDIKFSYSCKEQDSSTIGACVVENHFLCVGTSRGVIWLFTTNNDNTQFAIVDRILAHDNSMTLLDGGDEYFVTCSDTETFFWETKNKEFQNVRKVQIFGLSKPTSLKVVNGLVFIGYESGEFCIFDFLHESYFIREIAHRLKISSIDFSHLKHFMMTTSVDSYVKIWKFDQRNANVTCCFSYSNGVPLCAGAFLNYNCTEFCIVMENEVDVDFYIQEEYESEIYKEKL